MKKLYKSNKNKIFTGVIGGIGEYFNVDPVILRVFWLIIIVFTGFMPGIIAYIFTVLVIPKEPKK